MKVDRLLSRTRGTIIALAVVLLSRVPISAAAESPDNPRAAADDVVLPAPCGRTVAFRRVNTAEVSGDPLDSLLSDRRVLLGRAVEETGYLEYSRIEHVAGPFVDAAAGKRYFLLAKYETSAGLWGAVMSNGADCPDGDEARLPKTDVSWFDAVEFTRRYTAWLYEHHIESLPAVQDVPGFVRLPTETEWEYSARGGLAVSEAEFQKNVFSPDGGLQGYAWYGGAESADGELQEVGTVDEPNPLGLFDMLGNASEMVLDPFRLNRAGREHGLAGGFIAKGGSIDTPASEMRTSLREERDYFNPETRKETRVSTMGFRVAVSGVAMPDLRSINALRRSWNEAGAARVLSDDPTEALQGLAAEQTDPPLRQALDSIRQQVTREFALRNDLEARMLRNLLLSLASMQDNLVRLLASYNQYSDQERYYREQLVSAEDADRAGYEDRLAGVEQRKERSAGEFLDIGEVYVELLTQALSEFGAEQTSDEVRTLYAELIERNRQSLAGVVKNLDGVLKANRSNRNVGKIEILESVFGPLDFYRAP